jgi:alpha-mannosidase
MINRKPYANYRFVAVTSDKQVIEIANALEEVAFRPINRWVVARASDYGIPPGPTDAAAFSTVATGENCPFEKAWFCASVLLPPLANLLPTDEKNSVRLKIDHRGFGPVFVNGSLKRDVFLHGDLELAHRISADPLWLQTRLDIYKDKAFIQRAQVYVDDELGLSWKIRNLAISIRVAATLLSTDTRRKGLYLEEKTGINRSRIPADRRRHLRKLLWRIAEGLRIPDVAELSLDGLEQTVDNALAELMELSHFAKEFTLHLIGHSHLDLAWKWRWPESIVCGRDTIKNQLENMRAHPDFVFVESSPALWEAVEKDDPQLFEEIKAAVLRGQFEPVGGMWCEPDGNLPDGESFARQLLFGQRYSREKFGTTSSVGWNIDGFGYNANFPLIYRAAGIEAFLTQKLRYNRMNIFPEVAFWWESRDGSRIIGLHVLPDHYQEIDPEELATTVKDFNLASGFTNIPVLFGLGNHGGGPLPDMFDRIDECSRFTVFPNVKLSSIKAYIETIREAEELKSMPVLREELFLESHNKTYTTCGSAKKENRDCELLLANAEKLQSLARLLDRDFAPSSLDEPWKKVLLNQFHDILPGTSTAPVYQDAFDDYRLAKKEAKGEIRRAAGTLVGNRSRFSYTFAVFNPLNWTRTDSVEVPLRQASSQQLCAVDAAGNRFPVQVIGGARPRALFVARDVPALGFNTYTIEEGEAPSPEGRLDAGGLLLENDFFKIQLDPESGDILDIHVQDRGWSLIAPGALANQLQALEDVPAEFGAWDCGFTGKRWDLKEADSVELVENGPVRAIYRVHKSLFGDYKRKYIKALVWNTPGKEFPTSFFTQEIVLYRALNRIEFRLLVDWWEENRFLKVAFPLAVDSDWATFEIPFGTCRRSTRRETSKDKARYEVPALRWTDLSDGACGAALINRHKHGYDVLDNTIRLSLLTSPSSPNPSSVPHPLVDRGKHDIHYSLYPHLGTWQEGRVTHRGYEFNTPLVVFPVEEISEGVPAGEPMVSLGDNDLILTAFKPAHDGKGFILRFYEPYGRDTAAEITAFKPIRSAALCNFIEDDLRNAAPRDGSLTMEVKPHEVITLRLEFK